MKHSDCGFHSTTCEKGEKGDWVSQIGLSRNSKKETSLKKFQSKFENIARDTSSDQIPNMQFTSRLSSPYAALTTTISDDSSSHSSLHLLEYLTSTVTIGPDLSSHGSRSFPFDAPKHPTYSSNIRSHLSSDASPPSCGALRQITPTNCSRFLLSEDYLPRKYILCTISSPGTSTTASSKHSNHYRRRDSANIRQHPLQNDTPRLSWSSACQSASLTKQVHAHVPAPYGHADWQCIYSTMHDGASLGTLYHRCKNYSKCGIILLIRNTEGEVFGCYASQAWKVSPQ